MSESAAGDPLERLCKSALHALPASDAAVAVMNRLGHRGVVYASGTAAEALEDLAFTLGEGPCLEAFARTEPVLVNDLQGPVSERWPAYAEAATGLGCGAVFAFPLRVGAIAVGTLTFYNTAPARLSATDLDLVGAISGPAALALVARLDESDLNTHAHGGTFLRAEVYQASGMMMVQLQIPADEALLRLRAYAYAHGRPLNDVAHDVVARALRFEPDTN